MAASSTTSTAPARPSLRWRVVDIVIASVLGVAGGLVFVLWNLAYNPVTAPLEAFLPGLQALFHGIWLFPGVLVALIVRKPGAALYGEIVAASASVLISGTEWGPLTLLSGLVQGLGAELVLAILLYKAWGLIPAILAGAGAGVGMVVLDLILWYPGAALEFASIYAVSGVVSGAIFAGLGSWLIMRGLARTGALSRFAAGRELGSRAAS
ncbi:ECF transporter S component [Chryseoglobus sp. 28M-23]|uniref:ECF transporter S component n=1 Tax=Chryseoglobus sp. 28M-23 TaxID=2772253 RepID=UPI001747C739|nr:ECF transporter S component [Chryseoglobus sp. 28M-23]MBU1251611.1 ECF transporter S component [Actinomycetota bacterium]MBU1609074.1 ECF transporter S component [Actinomycetota bacterium]MBU2316854.1 ECF transporter S component [Actinomycetota bacterium]MBU2384107.1 ECF transporter S component [Actinomycetota bacterium]QOD93031.1 ECF transporter S component [Chryseoglobus sp. 28M-23]